MTGVEHWAAKIHLAKKGNISHWKEAIVCHCFFFYKKLLIDNVLFIRKCYFKCYEVATDFYAPLQCLE